MTPATTHLDPAGICGIPVAHSPTSFPAVSVLALATERWVALYPSTT